MFIRKILVLCVFVFGLSISISAQGIVEKSPTISTTGKAELFVEPDFVSFRLEVTKQNMDLKLAKTETDNVTAKIQSIARKYGLGSDEVSVTYISVEQKFRFVQNKDNRILDEDGDEVGRKEFVGYEASNIISIKLKDLSRFQPLLEELISSGVTEIDAVNFQTSKLRELKDKARTMAMKVAKEKALAMASAIGQTVGRALKVTEGANRSIYSNISANIVMSDGVSLTGVSTGFSPGVISVDAEVSVTFLLN